MATRNFGYTFGRTPEGAEADYNNLIKRLAEEGKKQQVKPEEQKENQKGDGKETDSMNVNANVDLGKCIQLGINGIHGKPVVISAYEYAGSNGKNYENAHRFAFENGVYVPTAEIFMNFFNKVMEAYNGNRTLNYGNGRVVPKQEVEDIYKHLTINFKDVFATGNPGVWTWLNGQFVEGSGFNGLDLEIINGMKKNKELVRGKIPLETCVNEDGVYCMPKCNSQGYLITKDSAQKYNQGKNIKFWKPVKGAVALFNANSGRAGLFCNWYPTVSNSSLGVFVCAEGA